MCLVLWLNGDWYCHRDLDLIQNYLWWLEYYTETKHRKGAWVSPHQFRYPVKPTFLIIWFMLETSVRSSSQQTVDLSANIPTRTKEVSHNGFARIIHDGIHTFRFVCANRYDHVGICSTDKWCNDSWFYHIALYGGTMSEIWWWQHQRSLYLSQL